MYMYESQFLTTKPFYLKIIDCMNTFVCYNMFLYRLLKAYSILADVAQSLFKKIVKGPIPFVSDRIADIKRIRIMNTETGATTTIYRQTFPEKVLYTTCPIILDSVIWLGVDRSKIYNNDGTLIGNQLFEVVYRDSVGKRIALLTPHGFAGYISTPVETGRVEDADPPIPDHMDYHFHTKECSKIEIDIKYLRTKLWRHRSQVKAPLYANFGDCNITKIVARLFSSFSKEVQSVTPTPAELMAYLRFTNCINMNTVAQVQGLELKQNGVGVILSYIDFLTVEEIKLLSDVQINFTN